MRKKKKVDIEPFDTKRTPPKQNLFFIPLLWLASYFATRSGGLKIQRANMKGLKPPYLVLASHHAFLDFPVSQIVLFPHRVNYVSELEGFEAYGEWFYRQLGCLGTRKFVYDMDLIKNIRKVMERKGILVLYPEARYANVGTSSKLSKSVFKLVKLLKVPVVVLDMKGNYLQSPIWNLKKRKGVRLHATIKQVITKADVKQLSLDEIAHILEEELTYDDYKYQYETKQCITDSNRAEGLELPLYQCPVCKTEFMMGTEKETICCHQCKGQWIMTEYGQLKGNKFSHIPDWYEWERKQVETEIDKGEYHLDVKVHIEALPNAKNFIVLGEGRLVHTEKGFDLMLKEFQKEEYETLHFSSSSMSSIHTEYNYRDKGQCVTLSTLTNTYFIYPLEEGFNPTKIQFATEYLYERTNANSIK